MTVEHICTPGAHGLVGHEVTHAIRGAEKVVLEREHPEHTLRHTRVAGGAHAICTMLYGVMRETGNLYTASYTHYNLLTSEF